METAINFPQIYLLDDEEIERRKKAIFGSYQFIPSEIQYEFVKRWELVPKVSFKNYFELIRIRKDTGWWHSADCINTSYQEYIIGYLNSRQPLLPTFAIDVLQEVVNEANYMINFN